MNNIEKKIVDKILIYDYSNKQLLEWLKLTYNYKQAYSYRLISKAREVVKKHYKNYIELKCKKKIDKMFLDYNKLVDNNKYEKAIDMIKEINKLVEKK